MIYLFQAYPQEIASEGYDLDALLNQHFAGRVVRKISPSNSRKGKRPGVCA